MPFLGQEGHVLRARKACSEMLSRPFSNREGRGEKSWRDFSLTEHTATSPPAPLRMERGVVCEVTPFGLLIEGDGLLGVQRKYRGISVITPLSIRRGAGGEASCGCVFFFSVFFCERKKGPL